MSDDVLVIDDMVYVSDESNRNALIEKDERRFLAMTSTGQFAVESPGGGSYSWKYAVKVPAPQYKPFTLDTLPKQHIMVREKGFNKCKSVIARSPHGVNVVDIQYPFTDLLENHEISLDYGDTWQPAGELV